MILNGTARYAHENNTWFINLSGDVRHPLAASLNALLDRAFTHEGSRFVVDVSAAETIDSTCLGVLARLINDNPNAAITRPVIITGGEDIQELLLAVCFDQDFDVVQSADLPKGELQPAPLVTVSADDTLNLLLEAHRRLCAIDVKNHAAFRDVVEAMEAEVTKQQGKRQHYLSN